MWLPAAMRPEPGHRIDDEGCRRLFAGARSARLATVGKDGPHIVPIVFAVDGDLVYSAVDAKPKTTTRLQRLINIERDPRVALLADHYADDWDELWWVRADGRASILPGPQRETALDLLSARYPRYRATRPPGPVVIVDVRRWTGWSATPVGGRPGTG